MNSPISRQPVKVPERMHETSKVFSAQKELAEKRIGSVKRSLLVAAMAIAMISLPSCSIFKKEEPKKMPAVEAGWHGEKMCERGTGFGKGLPPELNAPGLAQLIDELFESKMTIPSLPKNSVMRMDEESRICDIISLIEFYIGNTVEIKNGVDRQVGDEVVLKKMEEYHKRSIKNRKGLGDKAAARKEAEMVSGLAKLLRKSGLEKNLEDDRERKWKEVQATVDSMVNLMDSKKVKVGDGIKKKIQKKIDYIKWTDERGQITLWRFGEIGVWVGMLIGDQREMNQFTRPNEVADHIGELITAQRNLEFLELTSSSEKEKEAFGQVKKSFESMENYIYQGK